MAWSVSNISGAMVDNFFAPAAALSWTSDTINAALYGTTPTPDKNDTFAHNAYNGTGGQWVVANEITGTGYSAAGQALAGKSKSFSAGTTQITSTGPSWTGATITAGSCFGCLVYDSTLAAKNAFCWNYFGGGQGVTAGTFTIVWSGAGILQFTIT